MSPDFLVVGESAKTQINLLFLREAFYLFFDQFFIIEVIDLHCFLYISQCLGCGSSCHFASFSEHFVDSRNIFAEFFAAIANRFQRLLHDGIQEAFYFTSPNPPRW